MYYVLMFGKQLWGSWLSFVAMLYFRALTTRVLGCSLPSLMFNHLTHTLTHHIYTCAHTHTHTHTHAPASIDFKKLRKQELPSPRTPDADVNVNFFEDFNLVPYEIEQYDLEEDGFDDDF